MPAGIVAFLATLLVAVGPGLRSASAAPTNEPFRFLGVPIVGTIGADQTLDGIATSIALARDQGLDGLVLDIDARTGSLDDGVAIAGLVAAAADDLRTIAIIRRVGGAALPIAFACEDWIVLEETPIEVMNERGERVRQMLDADRVALQALPARGSTLDAVDATLAATRAACIRHLPGSLTERASRHRRLLAEVLATPGRDLMVRSTQGPEGGTEVTAIPARGSDEQATDAIILPVSKLGPGLSAGQLSLTGLALPTPEGLEPLAAALGVPSVESFGDTGAAIIASAADDRASARSALGSRIDSMFSSLEGAGQLIRALPWTLTRARLSDPTDPRRAGRLPMVHADGAWRLAPETLPFWTRICDDSIRRWDGVAELVKSVDELIDRAARFRGEIAAVDPQPADRERLAEALRISSEALDRVRSQRAELDGLAAEAKARVATLERWRETPPIVPDLGEAPSTNANR